MVQIHLTMTVVTEQISPEPIDSSGQPIFNPYQRRRSDDVDKE